VGFFFLSLFSTLVVIDADFLSLITSPVAGQEGGEGKKREPRPKAISLRVALLPHQTADENKFSYLNQTGIIFCFTFHFCSLKYFLFSYSVVFFFFVSLQIITNVPKNVISRKCLRVTVTFPSGALTFPFERVSPLDACSQRLSTIPQRGEATGSRREVS
jgi:hypothetical protein